jgi:hypothetical protein
MPVSAAEQALRRSRAVNSWRIERIASAQAVRQQQSNENATCELTHTCRTRSCDRMNGTMEVSAGQRRRCAVLLRTPSGRLKAGGPIADHTHSRSGTLSQTDDDTIRSISVEKLASAVAQPGAPMDHCSRQLLDEELKSLELRRKDVRRTNLTGIALSGGGIRSATFCLGVLQALAKADLLKRSDYLSTVSGGGYIGTSLTWWLRDRSRPDDPERDRPTFKLGPKDFPYGVDGATNVDPAKPENSEQAGPHLLKYLRQHGNYLTPGCGITILSGISVAIRAMFLSLFVWIPLITSGFFLLYWLPRAFFPYSSRFPHSSYKTRLREYICSDADPVTACLDKITNNDLSRLLSSWSPNISWEQLKAVLFISMMIFSIVIVVTIASALACYGLTKLRDWTTSQPHGKETRDYLGAWWVWMLIIVVFSVVSLFYVAPMFETDFSRSTTALTLVFIDAVLISLMLTTSAFIYYGLIKLFDWVKPRGYLKGMLKWLHAWWVWLPIIGVSAAAILLHAPPDLPADFQRYWLLILAAIMAGTFGILCLLYSGFAFLLTKLSVWSDRSRYTKPQAEGGRAAASKD